MRFEPALQDSFSRSGKIISPSVREIADTVRDARKAFGMTQTELAGLSGTGLRFVSELEGGKPTVSLIKVVDVLSVLGLGIQIIEKNKGIDSTTT